MKCPYCNTTNNDWAIQCKRCKQYLDYDNEFTSEYQNANESQPVQHTISGAHISLVASLVALFMFFMPWASCLGTSMIGFEMASETPWLFVVPGAAFLVFTLSFIAVRLFLLKPSKGAVIRIIISVIGGLPEVVIYFIREEIRPFLAFGFYGSFVAFLIAAIGGVVDLFLGFFSRSDE
jgi:hypothetical protein